MYHLLTIEYHKYADGKAKSVREQFLCEAVSLSDLETQIHTLFVTRLRNPWWHTVTQQRTLTDVIFHPGTTRNEFTADPFYQVKAVFFGEKQEYYVPAADPDEAIRRVLDYVSSLERKNLSLIKVTDVLGVWHPTNILWQGDFHNRGDLLYENGQCNYDRNQMEIDCMAVPVSANDLPVLSLVNKRKRQLLTA